MTNFTRDEAYIRNFVLREGKTTSNLGEEPDNLTPYGPQREKGTGEGRSGEYAKSGSS